MQDDEHSVEKGSKVGYLIDCCTCIDGSGTLRPGGHGGPSGSDVKTYRLTAADDKANSIPGDAGFAPGPGVLRRVRIPRRRT